MKALILNSGTGSRMGNITKNKPKCMTRIYGNETILSNQLKLLKECGVTQVVITTGFFDEMLREYCDSLNLGLEYVFVKNYKYDVTNYIYSMYLSKEFINDDVILIHGDLVFEYDVIRKIFKSKSSCVAISTTIDLPVKDFKAIIKNGKVQKIGVDYFQNSVAAQPFYKINKLDWEIWIKKIEEYCNKGLVTCYAENALNEVFNEMNMKAVDFGNYICQEVDTEEDLFDIMNKLEILS